MGSPLLTFAGSVLVLSSISHTVLDNFITTSLSCTLTVIHMMVPRAEGAVANGQHNAEGSVVASAVPVYDGATVITPQQEATDGPVPPREIKVVCCSVM